MHMPFRFLCEEGHEQIIALLDSEALKLGMTSIVLSRAYNIASVRRIQLRAPTGRMESSNTLLLLGVEESNAFLTLRGEDGKRLPWRDDFRSKVRLVYNIKGLPLVCALMSGWGSDLNSLWICAFDISTGHTVWWRSMHNTTVEDPCTELAHWSSQEAIVATSVLPNWKVALWAWKVLTGQEIFYYEIGHQEALVPHSIHFDIAETNDALCIGGTRNDGQSTLSLWSFEKMMMQAAAAEQQSDALVWHTHCNHGNSYPLIWEFKSLRYVADMIYGTSVNDSNILIGWDAVSGHRLFTRSFRHRVSAVVASGEMLVVGTDGECWHGGDIVSIHRHSLDEIWSKPNIGAVDALVPVRDKLYGCCYREELLSVLALDAATGDKLFSTSMSNYGIGVIDALLHEGGLLFVRLRSDEVNDGFICAVEAQTGKVMWDMHLANLTGGFIACAT